MADTKICSKCGRELPISQFYKSKSRKDGLHPQCKECIKQHYTENKEAILERRKQYYAKNKETIADYQKQYRKENKEAIAEQMKQYYTENKETILERIKQYRQENKESILECRKQHYTENKEAILERQKQHYAKNKESILEYQKQYRQENKERIKQYYAENKERKKQYHKQYYATLRGYCNSIRNSNIRTDRKYGRIGDELPSNYPTIEDYMELLQMPDFYDGKQYHFTEMGFDRIDNSLPHTLDNIVPCTTQHNIERHLMSFDAFKAKFIAES